MESFWVAIMFVVAGVLMLLAEYVAPKTYIALPGVLMLALGIIFLIYPEGVGDWWSSAIMVAVLVLLVFAAMKFFQMLAPSEQNEAIVAVSTAGKRGTVLEDVMPNATAGKIQFDDGTKSATAAVRIPAGAQVVVIEDKGTHVVVAEAEKKP